MTKHIEEFLSPYIDGELSDKQFQIVKSHLATCEKCASEFRELKNVKNLLHEGIVPTFPATDTFSKKVIRNLPDRNTMKTNYSRENIQWAFPVSIGILWVLLSSLTQVNSLIFTSFNLDILNWVSKIFVFPSWFEINLSSLLSQFGLINTDAQNIFSTLESVISANISFITIKIAISLVYLSWMIIWWSQNKGLNFYSTSKTKLNNILN